MKSSSVVLLVLFLVIIGALAVAVTSGDNLQEKALAFCSGENIASVEFTDSQNVIRTNSALLGAESTYYVNDGTSFSCPVVGPNSMTKECRDALSVTDWKKVCEPGSQLPQAKEVRIFYYNEDKDKDISGQISCSDKGLEDVTRYVPASDIKNEIDATLAMLLSGFLSEQEKSSGVTTEFPLPGVNVASTTLENGVLTIRFNDPQNKTGGGSCRVSILWAQVQATAKQFPGVTEVKFEPEALFQP